MRRFLVVDDSPTIRMMVRSGIRKALGEHVAVDEAEDAEGALARFQAEPPDVVFLDMVLGQGSTGGQALASILRSCPGARIVIVTGLSPEHPDVVEAISAGAFGLLRKPVRAEAIKDVLDQIRAEDGSQGRIR